MDEIATTAATSKTVYYRHFTDRAGLYEAVAARVDELILRDVRQALGGEAEAAAGAAAYAGDPRSVLAAAVDAYLRLVERDPEVYRFVVTAPLLAGGRVQVRSTAAADISRRVADQIGAVIEGALTERGADPAPALTWGHAVVGMVRAVADEWLAAEPEARPSRESLGAGLTALIWGGLASALA